MNVHGVKSLNSELIPSQQCQKWKTGRCSKDYVLSIGIAKSLRCTGITIIKIS